MLVLQEQVISRALNRGCPEFAALSSAGPQAKQASQMLGRALLEYYQRSQTLRQQVIDMQGSSSFHFDQLCPPAHPTKTKHVADM